jgi:hypothetical protein
MKYLGFVGADGRPAREDLTVMQREIPGWVEEMEGRGVRLLGRPLDLPHTAATVRVRDGETLITDGPFVEAKEFIAGFDLLDCADLDEVIEVEAKAPVAWFMAIEIRPFADEPWLDQDAAAFGHFEDGGTHPYALTVWTDGTTAGLAAGPDLTTAVEAWRQDLQARGLRILGGNLAGADTATMLQVRDGETLLGDGTFIRNGSFITAIDVVRCDDREQAVQLAAAHPAARQYAIEVRPFESS